MYIYLKKDNNTHNFINNSIDIIAGKRKTSDEM